MNILLDMDGVLFNFVKQACLYHDRPYEPETITEFHMEKIWGITPEEFWKPLEGEEFWSSMEPYPYAQEFYQKLTQLGEVTICSAPTQDPYCIPGKIKSLYTHLGITSDKCVFTQRKYLLGTDKAILIDDSQTNLDKFQENGGYWGVLFPQPWNGSTGPEGNYKHKMVLQTLKQGWDL